MSHAAAADDNDASPAVPTALWVIALTIAVALIKLEPKRRDVTRRGLSERSRPPRTRSRRPGFLIKPRVRDR